MFRSNKRKSKRRKSSGFRRNRNNSGVTEGRNQSKEKVKPIALHENVNNRRVYLAEQQNVLFQLHFKLRNFYEKHNPDKVNEDILAILMQFYIDKGSEALNSKLRSKYGEDLDTFGRGESYPTLPPPPTEDEDNNSDLHENINLDLEILDYPNQIVKPITNRNLIEAFFSIHDEEILNNSKELNEKVEFLNDYGVKALNKELFLKYNTNLNHYHELATRRRNLEDLLIKFYLKIDRSKLKTRDTLLRIIKWTMTNSISYLNERLITKYNEPLIEFTSDTYTISEDSSMSYDFYISHEMGYNFKNDVKVYEIINLLEEYGFRVYYGDYYNRSVKEIDDCFIFLSTITDKNLENRERLKEVEYVIQMDNISIISIVFDDNIDKIGFKKYIDLSKRNIQESEIDALVDQVYLEKNKRRKSDIVAQCKTAEECLRCCELLIKKHNDQHQIKPSLSLQILIDEVCAEHDIFEDAMILGFVTGRISFNVPEENLWKQDPNKVMVFII